MQNLVQVKGLNKFRFPREFSRKKISRIGYRWEETCVYAHVLLQDVHMIFCEFWVTKIDTFG